jgi:hypothetical protein
VSAFCPDGYLSLRAAIEEAARQRLAKQFDARASSPLPNGESGLAELSRALSQAAQHSEQEARAVRETARRMRQLLYQGKQLVAYYLSNGHLCAVQHELWGTPAADMFESGRLPLLGELFLRQSQLDALLSDQPAKKNVFFPEAKKQELVAAYLRPEIKDLPRKAQREAISILPEFRLLRITDDHFREAEKASGPRRPGAKKRRAIKSRR